MKHSFLTLISLLIISISSAYAQDTHTYKVTFFNTQSQNKELSEQACKEMMQTFDFSIQGNQYNFNQKDNPAYSNHKAIAFLTLKNTQFLEVDDIDTKFTNNGKEYKFTSHLFSITYTNPFMLKGIIVNPYCKSAYIVLLDDPNALDSTTVKSVSPTK